MSSPQVKEESLRCYCLRNTSAYDSLDIAQLSAMFELGEPEVHSICSKLILENDVNFAWDRSSRILIVKHEDDKSKFQRLTQTLADKACYLIEGQERTVDYKCGNYHKVGGLEERRSGINMWGGGIFRFFFHCTRRWNCTRRGLCARWTVQDGELGRTRGEDVICRAIDVGRRVRRGVSGRWP